jgi:hypothetical protein
MEAEFSSHAGKPSSFVARSQLVFRSETAGDNLCGAGTVPFLQMELVSR